MRRTPAKEQMIILLGTLEADQLEWLVVLIKRRGTKIFIPEDYDDKGLTQKLVDKGVIQKSWKDMGYRHHITSTVVKAYNEL